MLAAKKLKTSYKNESLPTDLGRLYMNATTSDVNFIFKPVDSQQERVPAHKSLLATRSDVFHAMFYGEVKEKGDINIVDATAAVFKEFLKFFYLSDIELTMENVSKVMDLGNKYNVTTCFNACVELLKTNLTEENVCRAYGLAILYENKDLKELCEKAIIENLETVFASTSFLDCQKEVLRHILDLDNLSCSEADVFKACMAWVQSASGKATVTKEDIRKHLGDLFYKIRFASMTIQEFAGLIPTFGHLFLIDEYKECVQMIASKDFQPKIFMAKTRKANESKDYTIIECNRVLQRLENYHYVRHNFAEFSTNESIMLFGLVFAGLRIFRDGKWRDDLMNLHPVEITITKISNKNGDKADLSTETVWLLCKDKTVVTLSKPISISPGYKYKIQWKPSSNEHCCKGSVLKTEVKLEHNIIIQFYNDSKTFNTNQPKSALIALRFYRIVN